MTGTGPSLRTRAFSVAAVALQAVLFAAALGLALVNGHPLDPLAAVAVVAYGTVGLVITWQRPGHRLGWLCAWIGFAFAITRR
ncbi:MAG: hypothetical protein ACR2MZ_00035 [Candidatus Dormibacter sp.]|uniref:hypothetical protein n=1 Tax=Candidatus Dormibacter sp. TaxID=2973982 RepID=UPI000DB84832|nr:MAG: hypothetical protein DLM66_09345 [Candidatus Dormibacteraeota bacterium]